MRYWDWNSALPVGTLYGIGRNYEDHAREMGAPLPAQPVVFLKPPSAYVPTGQAVYVPEWSHRVEHEVEIVVVLGKPLFCATAEEAMAAIVAYGVGIDLTLRDLQAEAKRSGLPWAVAKGFYRSAPVSPLVDARAVQFPLECALWVNGHCRQRGNSAQMRWQIPEILVYLSMVFALQPGDAVFTGTPAGVAPVAVGDRLVAALTYQDQIYTQLDVTVEKLPCTLLG